MASGKSNYLRQAILEQNLNIAAAYTPPTTLYVALSTAVWTPTATGGTLAATEPTNGYARVSVPNDATTWVTGLNLSRTNDVVISFASPSGSWGTILSFYLVDAASGGNILYGGDLFESRAITVGDIVTFNPGQLSVSET